MPPQNAPPFVDHDGAARAVGAQTAPQGLAAPIRPAVSVEGIGLQIVERLNGCQARPCRGSWPESSCPSGRRAGRRRGAGPPARLEGVSGQCQGDDRLGRMPAPQQIVFPVVPEQVGPDTPDQRDPPGAGRGRQTPGTHRGGRRPARPCSARTDQGPGGPHQMRSSSPGEMCAPRVASNIRSTAAGSMARPSARISWSASSGSHIMVRDRSRRFRVTWSAGWPLALSTHHADRVPRGHRKGSTHELHRRARVDSTHIIRDPISYLLGPRALSSKIEKSANGECSW